VLNLNQLLTQPISKLSLGTMTFGEQVNERDSHQILDCAFDHGINLIDTAEMYPIPANTKTYGLTEKIIGNWFKKNPQKRSNLICATKICGPARNINWIRGGLNLRAENFEEACNESLRRLRTESIDLYQIHWPIRHVPSFGQIYFDPLRDEAGQISIHEQLIALNKLVRAGKVRAVGLSNETPYGVHEFLRISREFNLPRIASIQNAYCLLNRSIENALDESISRLNLPLLAYSPLAFGLLTGKYDMSGFGGEFSPENARMTRYESIRRQRWGREFALDAARIYNQLAKENNMTPANMALAFCINKWQVASTIIGVTSVAQLKENLFAQHVTLSKELINKIDAIRWIYRDPAQ